MSDEHFTVDGTLIEAWASHKSFQRKDSKDKHGTGTGANFHGEKRTNQTHESKTDPEARLYKKAAGQEAKLSYRTPAIAAARSTRARPIGCRGNGHGVRFIGLRAAKCGNAGG
jgi:hypothetical protein